MLEALKFFLRTRPKIEALSEDNVRSENAVLGKKSKLIACPFQFNTLYMEILDDASTDATQIFAASVEFTMCYPSQSLVSGVIVNETGRWVLSFHHFQRRLPRI